MAEDADLQDVTDGLDETSSDSEVEADSQDGGVLGRYQEVGIDLSQDGTREQIQAALRFQQENQGRQFMDDNQVQELVRQRLAEELNRPDVRERLAQYYGFAQDGGEEMDPTDVRIRQLEQNLQLIAGAVQQAGGLARATAGETKAAQDLQVLERDWAGVKRSIPGADEVVSDEMFYNHIATSRQVPNKATLRSWAKGLVDKDNARLERRMATKRRPQRVVESGGTTEILPVEGETADQLINRLFPDG